MKKNELRIGNLVTDESNCPLEVFNILKTYVRVYIDNDLEELLIHYENLKPIPLTEEWLLKFGYYKESEFEYQFENNFAFGFFVGNKGLYFNLQSFNGNYLHKKVEYVHQLQNLYFALTGEELTKKEKPLTNSEGLSN